MSGRRVGDTRDGVDHQLTVSVHRDLHTALGARFDQLVDGLLDLLLNVGHHRSLRVAVTGVDRSAGEDSSLDPQDLSGPPATHLVGLAPADARTVSGRRVHS